MSESSNDSKSRWGKNSVDVGTLHGAPTEEHFQLHLAAIEYELSAPITIATEEDIQSRKHWSEKLKPFDHQIQNLFTFCRRAPVALFADDVGLGKTISAGLVLNELQTRKKVRRALILCPKMVIPQWKEELVEKFGIHSGTGVGKDLEPWLHHQVPVVITTYESARNRMDDIRAASFDMLILDEAHRLKNLYGTPKPPEFAKLIHESLVRRDFRYVLMLTATPIQNGLWNLYSLIDCLSRAKGHENPFGTPDEFVDRYVADTKTKAVQLRDGRKTEFRRKVEEYMVRTSRGRAGLVFPTRMVNPVQCDPSPAEKRLQKLVGTAMEGMNALAQVSLAEALMSSPRALLAQIRRSQQSKANGEDIQRQFEAGVLAAGDGCKLTRLLGILEGLKANNPNQWRALVFTRRKETVELITERLRERQISVGTIQGGEDSKNQSSVRAFRANPPGVHVIVSTDSGAVGLNLQVCNVVINYDLPWNPMVLEQRIGRVQRLKSDFKYVEVINLTVKGSIEDRIVACLMAKLQVISETIGDVEAILEASSFSDDEQFEIELRSLVTRALMGQDVEESLKKSQESIERAKAQYDLEKEMVEKTLGRNDAMHRAGPVAPKLKVRKPRFGVEEFCRKAFVSDGAVLEEFQNAQLKVRTRGRGSWIATFDDRDPDLFRAPSGVFGGASVRLYDHGSRHFEGLLGEWRKRHSHRVLDRQEESRNMVEECLLRWAKTLGLDVRLKEWEVRQEHRKFSGTMAIRATAAISHDRFEKLCSVNVGEIAPDSLPALSSPAIAIKELGLDELVPTVDDLLKQTVESDADITEFTKFYDARQAEEVVHAGESSRRREDVARRFETSLAAELVGAAGAIFLSLEVEAVFTDPKERADYKAELHLVPLTNSILSEPAREACGQTKRLVPESWLQSCAVTKQRVLSEFLEVSAISGTVALSNHFATCEATNRRVLNYELGQSSVSGKRVGSDLLVKSQASGRRALETEMVKCEVTGALVLPDELERSAVSGKMVRADRMVASEKSGVRGHPSEFRRCEETRALILESEGDHSSVSGKFVWEDLLESSEKDPTRRGLPNEVVHCAVSEKRLLVDEAVRSSVSGEWVDKDLAVYSGVSSLPALPEETVVCAVSGITCSTTIILPR